MPIRRILTKDTQQFYGEKTEYLKAFLINVFQIIEE